MPCLHSAGQALPLSLRCLYPVHVAFLGRRAGSLLLFVSSGPSSEVRQRAASRRARSRSPCCRRTSRGLPLHSGKDEREGKHAEGRKTGTSLPQVDPVQTESSVCFDGVGGLADHIAALKEMVLFPLLYPEFFERFQIRPPRGCLFCGPPGTGKTLVARALANECRQGDKRIAFFVRKGADCLSQWVGESERQLRSLFEQAYEKRPSIIFFDEIDGLAPVRSSHQDQIHSSIVTTLLALMDGLDSRGEVVVIGATNRPDSLDPALRRPGRFDREFLFTLPNRQARKEIFRIHTRGWSPKPSDTLLEELAETCVGYCGADIQALCAEAALCALHRHYPHIYTSSQKLQINVASIEITATDFVLAMQKTAPASQRAVASPGQPLPPASKPLLQNTLERLLKGVQRVFPLYCKEKRSFCHHSSPSNACGQPACHRPRFLIAGEPGYGQTSHLAPALLHALERFAVHVLDLPALFASSTPPEERCTQLVREAQRTAPSIIYMPHIHAWWEAAGVTLRATLTTLLERIPPYAPVLLLATSDVCHADLPEEVQALFSELYGEVFNVQPPSKEEGRKLFEDLLLHQAAPPAAPQRRAGCHALEVLPVASPPEPRLLAEEEERQLEEQEEHTLPAVPADASTPLPGGKFPPVFLFVLFCLVHQRYEKVG
ncbi:ATPase family AAA domain-containing protein 2-like [Struthio camelus]|uniref:ATPase family AAA domain-containing protein 2-like n=1 Tax=Struthio camelus TaxID=8801 RepID=UPI003603F51B